MGSNRLHPRPSPRSTPEGWDCVGASDPGRRAYGTACTAPTNRGSIRIRVRAWRPMTRFNVSKMIEAAGERAGLLYSHPHMLRHTCGHLLTDAGQTLGGCNCGLVMSISSTLRITAN